MKVFKFGGTSLGSTQRIENAIDLIKAEAESSGKTVVVVSAVGKTTDILLDIAERAARGDESYQDTLRELEIVHLDAARELIEPSRQTPILADAKRWLNNLEDLLSGVFLVKELSARSRDFILSFGERLSAFIVSHALNNRGIAAEYVDAREIIKTDDKFGSARVNFQSSCDNILKRLDRDVVYVVTGFIGSTESGETTTLGRGGSDYTASLLGSALSCEEIVIWTDVDGMMTADPRKVPKAFPLPQVSYEEAMELSHFGARVIHPPTMQPALDAGIPLRIKNSFNPAFEGTVIQRVVEDRGAAVTGISSIPNISLLTLKGSGMVGVAGISMRLFGALAKNDISVILITQASSEHTICFAVDPSSTDKARKVIEDEFRLELEAKIISPISVERDCSVVSAVGERMRNRPGISAKVFRAMGVNGINVSAIAQGSSELNISFVIASADEAKALNALHDEFFLAGTRSLNVFLAGSGLIGSALINQLAQQQQHLAEVLALDLRVLGIANSRAMIFDELGVDLTSALAQLQTSELPGGVDNLVKQMQKVNLPNSIFVDCSASESVVAKYADVLNKSVPIVTPNKKAQSVEYSKYEELKAISHNKNIEFLFETSVGAGLPVISTLADLLRSGDDLIEIQAVLSGTLSYIFNSFDGSESFSTVVKQAQQRGYTEPDPRDDLNGVDVARKILILAREAGAVIEPSDVEVENLVPEGCRSAATVDDFFEKLSQFDSYFEDLRQTAEKQHSKLCYIARLKDGTASVSLDMIDSSHPFYSLSGSDNIVSFTTRRYNERPLVVKGPGAGAEVTAAGVFADIIRLARFRRGL
ncbi:MAG: bifunctional aspartate kinase/homoserine dehydrogenase I [Bdellovibrionales bacterium]|nr:bifunctional aspartate kinase/homoserine dehydrogenase I [Bdellovibrionales bacterium]